MMKQMMSLTACLVVLTSLVGCKSDNEGKIEGTKWSSMAASVQGNTLPAGALKLEFGKDGSLKYTVATDVYAGTYSLRAGDKVKMTFDRELGGMKTHMEKIVINGDRLTMIDSDGTELTFTRE